MAFETSSLTLTPVTTHDIDSGATFRQYRIAIEVYVVGTLCALGIAGNLLSIVVLGRDRTIRRTTGFLLQMLAVADAVYLVACIFHQMLTCIVECKLDWLPSVVRRRWPYIEVHVWPMASLAQTATVWLVVVLTAHRYVAICRPLHAARYSTMSRVRKAVAAVWIFAAVYNLPRFFERVVGVVGVDVSANSTSPTVTSSPDLVPITSPETIVDSPRVVMQKSAMLNSRVYILVYKMCLFFVVRFLIPFAALAFCNQRLIRAMRASSRIRRHSGGNIVDSQDTRILVVVVLVFVICELPDLIMRACYMIYYHAPALCAHLKTPLYYLNVASNLMLTVNSSINFVIYCFMGRRFRLILLRTIRCRIDKHRPTPSFQFLLSVEGKRRQT